MIGNGIFESVDIVSLFQRVLVPVLMISGLGLFIMVMQTRYGRVVDRIRVLNNERLELIKKDMMKKISEIEKTWNDHRLHDIQEQVSVLVVRGKLLKDSLKFMFISIFTFIISSLFLFIEQIFKINVSLVVLVLFISGMLTLLSACINVIREVVSSYEAVIFDIDTHVPKDYRMDTKMGILGDLETKQKEK